MNAWWNQPAESRGYDPYDNPGIASYVMIAAMERAWKACLQAPSSEPLLIYPSPEYWDAYYHWLASPDRGHELEPYARA